MSPPFGESTSSKNTLATENSLEINNADAHPAADVIANNQKAIGEQFPEGHVVFAESGVTTKIMGLRLNTRPRRRRA